MTIRNEVGLPRGALPHGTELPRPLPAAIPAAPADALLTPTAYTDGMDPARAADPTALPGSVTRIATTPTSLVQGGVTIETNGASQAAIDQAVHLVDVMTKRPDVAERLRAEKVTLTIVPYDQKLTDLPELAHLRGQSTFDGRLWDNVRGMGGSRIPDGRLVIAAPEENLAELPEDRYPGNFSVALHELAHGIQDYAITAEERAEISAAFDERRALSSPFTDAYAASNASEYFAQGCNTFFTRNLGQGINGPAWLRTNDPRLYAILERIFGAPVEAHDDAPGDFMRRHRDDSRLVRGPAPTNLLGLLGSNRRDQG